VPLRDIFNLRPMEGPDLQTVWTWRNSERVRAVSYTDHEIAWEEHLAWYERSKSDESIQPMLFECATRPTGVVSFTRIDRQAGSTVWGFYIADAESPKGSGSIMGFLALDYAFGDLGLKEVIGESFVSNEASVRYHQRLGFREVEEERRRVEAGGEMREVMRLKVTAEWWQELRPSLEQRLFSEVKP
jgi:UDP-4-amino-4,6-dideoxy-N-acetyl-beta-L-altrosamine N-acetyltransferase